MFAQMVQKMFQGNRFLDGEDLRTRRHHFPHQLVAEFNSGPDQVDIVFFEDAFFFAGLKQRFHIDGRLLFRAGRLFRQRCH